MTITDIDKQKEKLRQEFLDIALPGRHKKHLPEQIIKDAEKTETKLFNWLYSKIYSQAKAEQREEDARVAKGKKGKAKLTGDSMLMNYGIEDGYNQACDSIASEIRGQHE